MDKEHLNRIIEVIQSVPRKITLVAVTKYVGIEETNEIINAGIQAIGENRIEAFEKKIFRLLPTERHFIGQIQSRKIKKIVELFDVIQSVGSIEHLDKIENEASKQHKNVRILLQFNISKEEKKGGFDINEVEQIMEICSSFKYIKIIGVMGMASHTNDDLIIRKQFRLLARIRDQLCVACPTITELSMGMSNDYQIALEEGATMLRIGSLIFHEKKS